MAARKKQEEQINLLPQKGFQSSTAGRILAWILSTFRIIVIVTEIIVMIAFLSRFWFDAQNTDLNEKIQQKQAVLTASRDFELRFKDIQKRIDIYSNLTSNSTLNSSSLKTVKGSLPSDIILTKIALQDDSLKIAGITPNERAIQQFVVNLASKATVKEVNLGGISTLPDNPVILIFTINAKVTPEKGG